MTIPKEHLRLIDEYAERASDHPEEWKDNEMSILIKTAKFGYELADQEKEAEAIEFGIWCNENVGCQLIVFSPEERKKIYQEFKQQTGGK